ncbi:MAG: DUF2460 domain-containing protein [Pelagimonas sp.]
MAFHDVRFPTDLSFGSVGGPERRTEIVELVSGYEERNTPWAHSRRRYHAGLGMRSLDDIDQLIAFFEARQGQMHGFRWKDWMDFKSCAASAQVTALDQQIGVGDGGQRVFALRKTYSSGGVAYQRRIAKPVVGTVLVAVGGVAQSHTLDGETGEITFDVAPAEGAAVTAGFEFDVPVRFDTDRIEVSASGFQAGQVPDVPVVEVRV